MNSVVRIPSIVQIPSCRFHSADSIMRILSCTFDFADSIFSITLEGCIDISIDQIVYVDFNFS